MSDDLEIVTVPRELYYHEVAYVRGLEADNERMKAAISYVRMRSQHACEILNEFDNTRREPKP
jgi:hypothetical protein